MMGLHPLSRVVVEARSAIEGLGCKWCPSCERIRHRSDFHACVSKRDGLQPRCMSCASVLQAAYYAANSRESAERHREWVAANEDHVRNYARAYRSRPERKEAHRRRAARVRSTVNGGLRNRIATRLYATLKGGKGGKRTEAILGYTISELRAHLERQFLKGMSWENMGQWHIDHIVPLASFTITGPDDPELRRAWALPNLRPLWAKENMSKGAKREVLL